MPLDLKPLTALRFAAASWVVCYLYWPDLSSGAMPQIVGKGYLGVEMFFVLSGFILSHVYLQAFGEGRFSYATFLWARVSRIYPLHLTCILALGALAAAAAAAGIALSGEMVNWAALPASLLALHAWGLAPASAWNHPSWSISAEFFAYLCFPAFAWTAWRLRDRPKMAVVGALILLFGLYAAFKALAGFPLSEATFRWGALRIVPCFTYGCAVYLLWRSGAVRTRIQATFWAAVLAALVPTLAQIGAPDEALVTVFGGVILMLAGLTDTGSKLLSGRVGVWLGEVSYAVYMTCFPWQLVFTHGARKVLHLNDGPLPPVLWLAMLAGVVPVAACAHYLIERPARTAMRRWADRGFPNPFAARSLSASNEVT
ncbi:MAG TPA: acyltransferase [Caulobacteraceae bacterium]|jgi:peptidoglycan/LPS O-acetylase OafA/YrhL|nr:acyltransferase [Caulobacteraceae bacterium]